MGGLKLLVENMVLIIMLAVFLEMLLPAGNLRRYVDLVVGLMIIVAVLQTVTGVLGHGLAVNLPFVDHTLPSGLDSALAAGQQMASQNSADALQGYEEALRRQITALASLNGELIVDGIQVNVPSDRASPSFGRLEGITVSVTAKPGTPDSRVTADVEGLKQELGNFYDIKPEAVSVDLAKGGG